MPGLQPAALGALAAGDGVLFAGGPGLGPGGGFNRRVPLLS